MLRKIADITASPDVQPRVALHYPTVEKYRAAIDDGEEFEPLRLLFDGKAHWLYEGFHRLEAFKLADYIDVPVVVDPGTKQDAILRAAASNYKHGLQRGDADIERAIKMVGAVLAERKERWTQEEIAQHCHCSQSTVSRVLGKYAAHNSPARAEKRAAVERALEAKPGAPAREVARDLEAKGVKVDHKTVQAVREEKARRQTDPVPPKAAAAQSRDVADAAPPPSAKVAVDRLPCPDDFPTKNHRDVIIAMVNSIRIARGFDAKHWEMAVRIAQYEIAVREYGAKETA